MFPFLYLLNTIDDIILLRSIAVDIDYEKKCSALSASAKVILLRRDRRPETKRTMRY